MTVEQDVVNYDISALNSYTFADLSEIKRNLETTLTDLFGKLDQHGVKMETSLLTFDGFPRSDIDVAQIRFIRARIVRLRNDYRQVMDRIEAELRDRYASVGADDESMANNSVVFARVTLIEPDSPASLAGFQLNDGIIQFGSIDATNHNGLQSLPVLVGNKKNQPIAVKISRNDETLDLSLTPQEWSGRGLIGFKLDLV